MKTRMTFSFLLFFLVLGANAQNLYSFNAFLHSDLKKSRIPMCPDTVFFSIVYTQKEKTKEHSGLLQQTCYTPFDNTRFAGRYRFK